MKCLNVTVIQLGNGSDEINCIPRSVRIDIYCRIPEIAPNRFTFSVSVVRHVSSMANLSASANSGASILRRPH